MKTLNRNMMIAGAILLCVPGVMAQQQTIPALNATVPPLPVSITAPFIAVSFSSDASAIIGGTSEFSAIFGDSGTRLIETETATVAPFDYNITSFYVMSTEASCGGLGAAETIVVTLRVDGANTALGGSCSTGADQNSFTLDTDTISVTAGQRLTISYALSGTILTRNVRLGVSAMGYTVQEGSTEETVIQTEPQEMNMTAIDVNVRFPGDVDSPGFDFWALFIFWAVMLAICLRMGWWLAAGFAVPGLLDAMFPSSVPETFAVWFVFVLIGVILEAAAARFSWGPYRKKTGM